MRKREEERETTFSRARNQTRQGTCDETDRDKLLHVAVVSASFFLLQSQSERKTEDSIRNRDKFKPPSHGDNIALVIVGNCNRGLVSISTCLSLQRRTVSLSVALRTCVHPSSPLPPSIFVDPHRRPVGSTQVPQVMTHTNRTLTAKSPYEVSSFLSSIYCHPLARGRDSIFSRLQDRI